MRRRFGWLLVFMVSVWLFGYASGPSAAVTPEMAPVLELTVQSAGEGRFAVRVVLRDSRGQPVVGVPVRLFQETTFGRLSIGSIQTDSTGTALTAFMAERASTLTVIAIFDGGEGLGPAKATQTLALAPIEPSPPFAGLTAPSPPPLFALVLGMVVGSVWVTYGYVAYLLGRIRRESKLPAVRR